MKHDETSFRELESKKVARVCCVPTAIGQMLSFLIINAEQES